MLTWPATELAELREKLAEFIEEVRLLRIALRGRDAEIARLRSENVRLRDKLYGAQIDRDLETQFGSAMKEAGYR